MGNSFINTVRIRMIEIKTKKGTMCFSHIDSVEMKRGFISIYSGKGCMNISRENSVTAVVSLFGDYASYENGWKELLDKMIEDSKSIVKKDWEFIKDILLKELKKVDDRSESSDLSRMMWKIINNIKGKISELE